MKPMSRALRRLCSALLGCSMGVSLLQLPIAAAPAELVNRAADFTIQVPSEQNDAKSAANLTDCDNNTLWVANGAQWPSTITIIPPVDAPVVYKAIFRFESGFAGRTTDLHLEHVINNVTSDPIVDREANDFSHGNDFVMEWEDGVSFTSLSLTISDPKLDGAAGQYWPNLAEVEIYTEKQAEQPAADLFNAAVLGTISANMQRDTPSNLTDENYNTLYVFSTGMSGTPNPWVQVSLDKAREVHSIETAFEKTDPDAMGFQFTYNILGRAENSDEWITLAENQHATRLAEGNIQTFTLPEPQVLKDVRIAITNISSSGGDPWPALAELKIFTPADSDPGQEDPDNIAAGKTIHTNTNQNMVSRLVDGSLNTVWEGEMYPAYVDIDLGENYQLDDAMVYTPSAGYSQYSIYTSLDGETFDRVARKTTKTACTDEGETWALEQKEARVVRLYMEYNSNSSKSQVREFKLHGTRTGTPVKNAPAVPVSDFEDSDYDVPVTAADTIAEVQGIITRRLGAEYVDWFRFELADAANGYDYYDVLGEEGKILIRGNNGVSLATGLNAWLKECAKVNLSQVSDQAKMPESIVLPETPLHKETKYPVRYSYNFCTLSYSMAFWGESEWREELDWLALNGVNVVLDATGEEEVWRRFLSECGYTHQEIKDFLAGPAYYAWFYMDNLSGMGGPLPDAWFAQRTELARKNHQIMQRLGMQPVLQGYCGMVPTDFTDKQPDAKVIVQGKWCQFQRPYMLKTDDPDTFDKYAAMFYKHQLAVYGDVTNYYATDPFHEGGNTGGMNVSTIASQTLKAMMQADADAVWIIQSWQGNPSNELLNGLAGNRDHALILDLYAERQPHWNAASGYGNGEFADTPWVYCMLNNFGGRLGLHGHLDTLNTALPAAANTAEHMAGIGITPEASQNNPILYEFFFDTIWQDDASQPLPVIDLDDWLDEYALRRYGGQSDSARAALEILKDTVYNSQMNQSPSESGQGAPESVVNARPALSISSASSWGFSNIKYDKKDLEEALRLLLADYDLLKDSQGYRYDLVNVAQQVLSNTAQEYLEKMNEAYTSNDLNEFTAWSDKFLTLIDTSDQLLSTQRFFLLGNWTQAAGRMIENPDDFTADLFDLNAKALVSTWGSITQCNSGGLHDYSNRQWAGLTSDLYKQRWSLFIDLKKKELSGQSVTNYNASTWFELEWAWARDHDTTYTDQPADLDIQALAENVVKNYSVKGLNAAAEDDRDLEAEKMSALAGSTQTAAGEIASNVLDGSASTMWHSAYQNNDRSTLWIELDLDEPATLDGLRYLPRSNAGNGCITGYVIEVQAPDSKTWVEVSSGSWARTSSWKLASFDPVYASKVRLKASASYSDNANNIFASAAEIRLTGQWGELNPVSLDDSHLQAAIALAQSLDASQFVSTDALRDPLADARFAAGSAQSQMELDQAAKALANALLSLRRLPDSNKLPG